jgi:hypothetical protein
MIPADAVFFEGVWHLSERLHIRDQERIQTEPWPFRWGHPAPGWGPDLPRHPLDSPGPELPPAMLAARRREARRPERGRTPDQCAVQASLYAQAAGRVFRPGRDGAEPDLIIVDEVAETGYAFHRLLEQLEMRRRR